MNVNPEYFRAMFEIERTKFEFENGRQLPKVAQKFIEMGIERGVKIEIIYGTNLEGDDIVAGYWIRATEKGKQLFQQDIAVDDESDENINLATEWMTRALDRLETI